nr:hypothetical protein 18 [Desulfobulbaceae bacterium]
MAIRFRRTMKIAPGVRVNVGKRGVSLSGGVRGANVTVGKTGVRTTAGIPGTGLSYTKLHKGKKDERASKDPQKSSDSKVSVSLSLDENGDLQFLDENEEVLPPQMKKHALEQHSEEISSFLQEKANQLNEGIEDILNIHLHTPPPEQSQTFKPRPFKTKKPTKPSLKQIGFLDKLIKSKAKKIEEENQLKMDEYDEELKLYEINRKKHFQSEEERENNFFSRMSNSEEMSSFLESYLTNIEFPRETLISFDLNIDTKTVFIDIDLPEIEDLPNQQATISKSGLKINVKERSDTQKRKDYMNHIHGVGFLIIGHVFASLPKIESVVCSGYSQRMSNTTGNVEDEYLYSVKVNREDWSKMNFSNLEAISMPECLGSFDIKRNMTKTGLFKPIEPFSIQ